MTAELRTKEKQSIEYALRQGVRCRNYGPEHERTENENVIVILADEIERLREELRKAQQLTVRLGNELRKQRA